LSRARASGLDATTRGRNPPSARAEASAACEETDPIRCARDEFNKVRDKLVAQGICPPCLDGPAMDALADSLTAQLDAVNDDVYPCGLAP